MVNNFIYFFLSNKIFIEYIHFYAHILFKFKFPALYISGTEKKRKNETARGNVHTPHVNHDPKCKQRQTKVLIFLNNRTYDREDVTSFVCYIKLF